MRYLILGLIILCAYTDNKQEFFNTGEEKIKASNFKEGGFSVRCLRG